MAAEHWFRSHHGAPTDKKWVVIARKAGTIPGIAAMIWWALMDHASQNSPRGSVARFDSEALDAFCGFDEGTTDRVMGVLRDRRMIEADDMLASWERRQPRREDPSAERVRRFRERQARPETTPPEPPRNAVKRDVTLETETETEEKREETDTTEQQHPPRKEGEAEQAEMLTDLNLETSALDTAVRGRMRAGAKAIISGDDKATWRDPNNSEQVVPWPLRPAIFRAALAEAFSEGMYTTNAIASKVRYQVKRQLAPLPPRIAPGSQAAHIAGSIPRDNRGAEKYSATGGNRVGAFAAPSVTVSDGKAIIHADTTAFKQGTEETAAIQQWMDAHPSETEAFKDRITRELVAAGKDKDPGSRMDAAIRLRALVRDALKSEAA